MLDDGSEQSRGQLFINWLTEFEIFDQKKAHPLKYLRIDPIFENKELIEDLIQRGSFIQYQDEDGINKIEEKIENSKEKYYNAPICGVFITFETSSHFRRATNMFKKEKHPF